MTENGSTAVLEQEISIGDIVEVLGPSEIMATLDADGSLDGLPFMPEMIAYCGRRLRVSCKVEKTCVAFASAEKGGAPQMKEFLNNDVVFLEDLRCSGVEHGHCNRGCMLFWKTRWLRKTSGKLPETDPDREAIERLHSGLKIKETPRRYFCQSTQLGVATSQLSALRRLQKIPREMRAKGPSIANVAGSILYPVWRQLTRDPQPHGKLKETPESALELEPGEIVEVRSYHEILRTLDHQGANKGLLFVADMKRFCGTRRTVRARLERMILEESGEMVECKHTVILDGGTCSYSRRFAGCPRLEFLYWREIWLRRVGA